MGVLSGLEPKKVFEYFEEISKVPRGSGKTEKITAYCIDFAKKHGLEFYTDSTGNAVVYKKGSDGREGEPPVILQGHLDMVWEKTKDSDINFETDALRLGVDGDYIYAEGTTLGGDDGIAVAFTLAILSDDSLSHPPIEAVFTVDEETGMDGAFALDTSVLKGSRMINMDSEAEDILWVSCAGGARVDIHLELKEIPASMKAKSIEICGLHGGHSGSEIHKHYANATVLAGRMLNELSAEHRLLVSCVEGGRMDNAITRSCRVVLCTDDDISADIAECEKKIKAEYAVSDPDIRFVLSDDKADKCFDEKSSASLVSLLSSLPYGVIKMSSEIEGLVQTSLNPGYTQTENGGVTVGFSVRSSVDSERDDLINQLKALAAENGAETATSGEYPAWEYRKDSALRETMLTVYDDLYGRRPEITAIHAGLECGLFSNKIKNLDCVSIGPDMQNIHTPDERLSISSSGRVYNLVVKTLERI